MHSEVILCSCINSINNHSPEKTCGQSLCPTTEQATKPPLNQIFGNVRRRGGKDISRRPITNTGTTTPSQMKIQAVADSWGIDEVILPQIPATRWFLFEPEAVLCS